MNHNKDMDHMPNQIWHKRVSFIKSFFRIAGFFALPFSIVSGAAILIIAELLGIAEELV